MLWTILSPGKNHLASGALRVRVLGATLIAAFLMVPGAVLSHPWELNGIAVCAANNDQITPAIATDGSGGSIIVWQDYRGGNYDIYTQGFNTSSVGIEIGLPPDGSTLYLSPASSNPSSIAVWISYTLPKSGEVELAVYDIAGQKVATLARGVMSAGRHEVSWNTASVAAGVYFYRLSFDG